MKTCKISDLETVRLLADPLKLRLLQVFAEGPATTREVAERLGEKLTRLYRHVDALHDAGLLKIVAEAPKRGTVERTFQAVAERFEVDQALFLQDDGEAGHAAIHETLQAVETEFMQALSQEGSEPLLMRLRVRASPARLRALQDKLEAWLEEANDEADDDAEASAQAGGLIAFYPLRE